MNDQYFFKIGHCNMPKNNLDREIQKFAHSLDGTLIDKGCLEAFKSRFKDLVDLAHFHHPRCKELRLSFLDHRDTGEPTIDCGSTTAHIYKVKQHYPS